MGRRTFFGLPGNMLKVEPLFNAVVGLIFLVKDHLCQLGEKIRFSGQAFFIGSRRHTNQIPAIRRPEFGEGLSYR